MTCFTFCRFAIVDRHLPLLFTVEEQLFNFSNEYISKIWSANEHL